MRNIFIVFLLALTSLIYAQELAPSATWGFAGKTNFIGNLGEQKIDSPYYTNTVNYQQLGASYEALIKYDLLFGNFSFSLYPVYRLENSQHNFFLKKFEFSYVTDTFIFSISKDIDKRALVTNKDLLNRTGADIYYDDQFTFWKASASYLPNSWLSIEAGSKLIRETYQYEWQGYDASIVKSFGYADVNYSGLTGHLGYALAYDYRDANNKKYINNYTAKFGYSYNEIIEGYTAGLFTQEFNSNPDLANFTFVGGIKSSLATALDIPVDVFDARPAVEIIYAQKKWDLAWNLSLSYYDLILADALRYTIDFNTISNTVSCKYSHENFSIVFYYTFLYNKVSEFGVSNTSNRHNLGLEIELKM